MPNRQMAALVNSLILLFFAFLAAGCNRPAVVINPTSQASHEVLDLRIGEELTIEGYPPEAIQVVDDGILQPSQATNDDTRGTTAQTTFVAVTAGRTELIVTRSLCPAVTSNCGEPAFYYIFQVRVR